jgi:hypothetical protein
MYSTEHIRDLRLEVLTARRVTMLMMAAFWDIVPCSLVEVDLRFRGANCLCQGDHHKALLMTTVRTSKTSVYFKETTRRYIPEACHLHTHRRESLKCDR